MEAWRFTDIRPILRTDFTSQLAPAEITVTENDLRPWLFGEPTWPRLVFVNGFLAPELCRNTEDNEAFEIITLRRAVSGEPGWAQEHLGACVNGVTNAFAALNGALLLDAALIRIKRGQTAGAPIHIVHVATGGPEPQAYYPRNLIVAEALSEATVVETYASAAAEGGESYLNNVVTEVRLEDGARLRRIKVLEEAANAYHLSETTVRQEGNSGLDSHNLYLSGEIARNDVTVHLEGENAEANLRGLYLGDDAETIDNHVNVKHHAPHCRSWMNYKGVLDDASHAVFTGKVEVDRGAQKTDSDQLNQNLVLSDKADVDTKPQLEIYADDVKCAHGATVGPPPKDVIFYFQTRGISEDRARGMLTYGFAGEAVRRLPVAPLRARLARKVFDRYNRVGA
jgi:Fe-S cluster assembly protein SufD